MNVGSRRVPIGAVGVLRFMRARMSEDTAQGRESELQDAREVTIFFRHGFTQIYADLNLRRERIVSWCAVGISQNFHQIRRISTAPMKSNSPTRSVSAFICVHRRFIFIFNRRYTQIHADTRGCGYVRDSFMCSRACGAFYNRRAVGILRFGRARMSENRCRDRKVSYRARACFPFCFQIRIHSRFEFMRDFVRGGACRSALSKIDMGSRYN